MANLSRTALTKFATYFLICKLEEYKGFKDDCLRFAMIDPWRTTFHHAEGGLSWRRQLIKMANRHISQWLEQLSLFTIHSMAVTQARDIIKLRQISTEGPESSHVCECVLPWNAVCRSANAVFHNPTGGEEPSDPK